MPLADGDGADSAGDEPPPYSNPPPECFSTPTPPRIGSHDFPPFIIPSLSEQTCPTAFAVLYPRGLLEKHGITQNDWVRFLEDLIIAARLSAQGRSAVGSRVPATVFPMRGAFIMSLVGTAYDAAFARGPLREVEALLGVWNQSAFERRKLRVSLHVRD
ncbi:hypothetical protein BKA83DRAFT_4286145 [Pisolithus microcarpus]|nr:hypothetical protein BKA83DRAFT_4286145 [Pisolithus microcarpus]